MALLDNSSTLNKLPIRALRWTAIIVTMAPVLLLAIPFGASPMFGAIVIAGVAVLIFAETPTKVRWRAFAAIILSGIVLWRFELQHAAFASAIGGMAWASSMDNPLPRMQTIHSGIASLIAHNAMFWFAFPILPISSLTLNLLLLAITPNIALLYASWKRDYPPVPNILSTIAELPTPFRGPIQKARQSVHYLESQHISAHTRRGIIEVLNAIIALQHLRLQLQLEQSNCDTEHLQKRLEHTNAKILHSPFRATLQATSHQLEQLLHRHTRLQHESARCEALVDYAVSFLQDTRIQYSLSNGVKSLDIQIGLTGVLKSIRNTLDTERNLQHASGEVNGLDAV